MKPLICLQCGGKITDYKPTGTFTVCGYCETRFVIEQAKKEYVAPPSTPPTPYVLPTPYVPPEPMIYKSRKNSGGNNGVLVSIIALVLVVFLGGVFLFATFSNKKISRNHYPISSRPEYSTPSYTPPPSPTPKLDLLEFGGKGTGEGLFQDASSIAVDKKGRIYVGDDSLRVQQFDAKGKFLKLWQIPSETVNYRRARTIHKVAVDNDENLYVAVGGVILVYKQNADKPFLTMHDAPDYTTDFALRSDGGVLTISNNDEIETLFFVSKNRKITRTIKGFHSDTADASMSPWDVGLAAIRIAVDGAGNIYSIYALGDLGSYQLSYNPEDFRIFRFNANGKYVNKFVQTMDSVGIETDNQSRIYISRNDALEIYSGEGELLSTVSDFKRLGAFALDKQNNIYVLGDDRVVKRAAVQ